MPALQHRQGALVLDFGQCSHKKCGLSSWDNTLYWWWPLPPNCKNMLSISSVLRALNSDASQTDWMATRNSDVWNCLMNDLICACPEMVVDRRWLIEAVYSWKDWLDGPWLMTAWRVTAQKATAWWMTAWLKTAQWSRVGHCLLPREEVATVMLVCWKHHSALRLGGRLAGPNPIDSHPIQMIHHWMPRSRERCPK